ncbi:CU044_5270 family protein [Streptomyces sp. NPDC004667]|uniref:CU044_5270 family protein n=1 Tax=Streptomyces sp. NPDC004667 TaxID=3154285 RepID=UPI0033AC5855
MNAFPSRPEEAECEEMARLLPAPAERDLPPGRHRHHREILMQQIQHDRHDVSDPARGTVRRGRGIMRPGFLVPAAAMAAAGVLITSLAIGRHDSPGGPAEQSISVQAGNAAGATALLDRIASVAAHRTVTPVRDDQFVYVYSKVAGSEPTEQRTDDGPAKLSALHERRIWLSQDPSPQGADHGMIREDGTQLGMAAPSPSGGGGSGGVPAGIDRPTYQWLASLPTDPDALLKKLYADTKAYGSGGQDQAVFDKVGELLRESVMPPQTAAALYKAVAKIPGVIEVPDAVDAAGRHGVGIAREDTSLSQRTEWIFDKSSLAYLGQRSYLTKDTKQGEAGTLTSLSAVLTRAVVDKAGQEGAAASG